MSAGDYLEDELVDHITGKGSYTMPTIYIFVSTADPTDDGSGVAEPAGSGYARVATEAADWDASSGGSASNAVAITFPKATGAWGELTHFGAYDAATDGNMLWYGELTTPKTISSGEIARFPIGSLTVTVA